MSDATTPANPTDQIATVTAVLSPETPIVPTSCTKRVPDDSEAAVVQDAQQATHEYRVDYLRSVVVQDDNRANTNGFAEALLDYILAERDALLAEHEAFVSDHRCGIDGLQGCDYCAAHDKVERMIRGE